MYVWNSVIVEYRVRLTHFSVVALVRGTQTPPSSLQLSVLASETPKLTHLTASRPKVRNRRPPKKYAVFHEDDSKEVKCVCVVGGCEGLVSR